MMATAGRIEEGDFESWFVVYGGIHDGSPKCRRNYRRWIDGRM
jgi:hypothetical protein